MAAQISKKRKVSLNTLNNKSSLFRTSSYRADSAGSFATSCRPGYSSILEVFSDLKGLVHFALFFSILAFISVAWVSDGSAIAMTAPI